MILLKLHKNENSEVVSLCDSNLIGKPRLVLGRKLASSLINEKIKQYAELFVLCTECKKPDTQLKKEDRITTIKCTACGAKHPVKAKI